VDATTVEKIRRAPAKAGDLTERQLVFCTGCSMDMPERQALRSTRGPAIHDVGGEVEICRDVSLLHCGARATRIHLAATEVKDRQQDGAAPVGNLKRGRNAGFISIYAALQKPTKETKAQAPCSKPPIQAEHNDQGVVSFE
jgi:hypothetical protein